MIFLDTTRTARAGHRSGLTRVTARLGESLGERARPAAWNAVPDARSATGDVFFTAELFSERERPGFTAFLEQKSLLKAALFHDAIPLKFPQITWPQSVERHPGYMKLLSRFDRVFAVSNASRDELLGFWRWQRIDGVPRVDVLPLGADFDGTPRHRSPAAAPAPIVLCLGILEPRKNQSFLLDICARLWDSGLKFELHVAGRVNPHFGQPIVDKIRSLQRTHAGLHFHEAPSDDALAELFARCRLSVFPTIAEGCGLPLLESLWRGVPCLASDLPPIRENAVGGGCLCVKPGDSESWSFALSRLLTDDQLWRRLADDASSRPLTTWADSARLLVDGLVTPA